MIGRQVTIINKLGLHARAAAKLVATASAFNSNILIGRDDNLADCKSIMSVMMLAAGQGSVLRFEVDGRDEQQALSAIVDLIGRRFDEEE